MEPLVLHEFHQGLSAQFAEDNGFEVVNDYGDFLAEYRALRQVAGVLDLSARSRLCLTGGDRIRFLHGQITNDIKRLGVGEGCYAALTNTKGRMESDLSVYNLQDELLLDFETGMARVVSQRLEKYIVADDVQVVDVGSLYGLLSVQGPEAERVVSALGFFDRAPGIAFTSVKATDATLGELYLMNRSRFGSQGFDLFVPGASLGAVADKLIAGAKSAGGRACGWQAFETVRVEAGIPRFGVDMDGSNFPQESGIEETAVSYTKGCYIGQEVLNRIHTQGHVNKQLCGLMFPAGLARLPQKGEKLFDKGKEGGYIASTIFSPTLDRGIGLGYLRKEHTNIGHKLTGPSGEFEVEVRARELPNSAKP